MIFNKNIKPYKTRNMIIKKSNIQPEPPAELQPSTNEVGYIKVGVFTALGALPVKDAVVTVYHTYDGGEEHVLYHLSTDESGRAPKIEVPIEFSGVGQQTEYDYSTYNMRIQAIGYYTENILDLQVFPNITTTFSINLIPVSQTGTPNRQQKTTVIPSRPDATLFP